MGAGSKKPGWEAQSTALREALKQTKAAAKGDKVWWRRKHAACFAQNMKHSIH